MFSAATVTRTHVKGKPSPIGVFREVNRNGVQKSPHAGIHVSAERRVSGGLRVRDVRR